MTRTKADSTRKWSDVFCRSRTTRGSLLEPYFYVRGSREWMSDCMSYPRGHEWTDRVLAILARHGIEITERHSGGICNADAHTMCATFLDGGFDLNAGNYFYGEGKGAYVFGIEALKLIVSELGLEPPRRLKVHSAEILEFPEERFVRVFESAFFRSHFAGEDLRLKGPLRVTLPDGLVKDRAWLRVVEVEGERFVECASDGDDSRWLRLLEVLRDTTDELVVVVEPASEGTGSARGVVRIQPAVHDSSSTAGAPAGGPRRHL